jgi:hypothetical protein
MTRFAAIAVAMALVVDFPAALAEFEGLLSAQRVENAQDAPEDRSQPAGGGQRSPGAASVGARRQGISEQRGRRQARVLLRAERPG